MIEVMKNHPSSKWMFVGASLLLSSTANLYASNPSLSPDESATMAVVGTTQQAKYVLKGTVSDATGPVIGANVVERGTNNGTITDADGNFSLTVSPNATLLVSYIGYKAQTVAVDGKRTLRVTLVEDSKSINEVVVVGYGTQKKVDLSGSVSAINVSELTESRPVTNISQAMAGLAAGVQVTSANNRPGADDATIIIRGQGTLNSSAPLVIIDGMEGSISSVNPQDIENISVLKDAASAAIYGSRAANGVVLITTKSGKSGAVKVDYNGYVSLQSMRKTLTPISNYADYMELVNEGYANSNLAAVFSQAKIDEWRAAGSSDPDGHPNSNWVDETFKNSVANNHNISVSGGNDRVTFFTSFGYLNNPGIMENSGERKYNGRLNLEAKVTDWLKIGVNANGSHAERDLGTDQIDDVFTYAAASAPSLCYRSSDGRYGANQNDEDNPQVNNSLRRLNSLAGGYDVNNYKTRFFGTLSPIKGLDIRASYTFSIADTHKELTPVFIDLWNFQTNTVSTSGTGKSYVTNADTKTYRYFSDVTANYQNNFFDKRLSFNVLVGASQEQFRYKTFSTTKYDLISTTLDAINAATGDASASGYKREWAMRSYFGRLNLGWDDKYLLEANFRADGSSRFLKDNRWGYFPSVSAAWRISQESFMEDTKDWLDNLKLRASYGSLGNNTLDSDNRDTGGNYSAQSLFSSANYVWGSSLAVGMAQTSLANANLTWETTYVTNVGVDFGVLSNRLTGTLEYFNKKTKDILIDLPAPAVHGTSSLPKQNSATVSNKGFELTLGWQDRINDFTYGLNGNFTYVKNNVDKFKGDDYSLSGVKMIKEGLPINSLYMLQVDRLVQTDEDLAVVQAMVDANPNAFKAYGKPEKGDLLYKDANGDGVIDSNDRVIVSKNSLPRFSFGLTLNAGWKNFDLSVLFQGMAGYKTFFQSAAYNTPTVRWGYQINKEVAEGRYYEGRTTKATYPRLLEYSNTRNTQNSDFYLYDNSFFKIRNIQLGYTIPTKLLQPIHIDRIRVYASLENFFTFTDYKGIDPEVTSVSYPTIRQAVFGVNVTF